MVIGDYDSLNIVLIYLTMININILIQYWNVLCSKMEKNLFLAKKKMIAVMPRFGKNIVMYF